MTTIATDGHWIAADGLLTSNGSVVIRDAKKIRVVGHTTIYALSGTTCMFEPLIAWHKAGANASEVPSGLDAGWTLLTITRDGIFSYCKECPYPERQTYPWAQGSGNEYAMGAMRAGASVERAVQIACDIDVSSGGEIQVVNIKEALGMAPRLVEAG